jgi:hypothetical protein
LAAETAGSPHGPWWLAKEGNEHRPIEAALNVLLRNWWVSRIGRAYHGSGNPDKSIVVTSTERHAAEGPGALVDGSKEGLKFRREKSRSVVRLNCCRR